MRFYLIRALADAHTGGIVYDLMCLFNCDWNYIDSRNYTSKSCCGALVAIFIVMYSTMFEYPLAMHIRFSWYKQLGGAPACDKGTDRILLH